ncbi:MAG: hypothetical protein KAU60_09115, partial [Desulfobacterales bacterium]|nr:hypothetical protein [Desulfobacterales bacterium]
VEFKPATRMTPFRSFKHHKVEALELAGGIDGIVFATDDENFGSSLTFSDFEFDPSGRYNKIQSKYKIRPGLELKQRAHSP